MVTQLILGTFDHYFRSHLGLTSSHEITQLVFSTMMHLSMLVMCEKINCVH